MTPAADALVRALAKSHTDLPLIRVLRLVHEDLAPAVAVLDNTDELFAYAVVRAVADELLCDSEGLALLHATGNDRRHLPDAVESQRRLDHLRDDWANIHAYTDVPPGVSAVNLADQMKAEAAEEVLRLVKAMTAGAS